MSYSHKRTILYETSSGIVRNEITASEDGELEISIDVPPDTADMQVACNLEAAQLAALLLSADGALTVETNDGTTPDDTFTLDENDPVSYVADTQDSNPLSEDVTALYLTNASETATVHFDLRAVYDPEPAA